MLPLANLARKHLELIRNALHAISQSAEKLVVHLSLSQHLHKLVVGQEVKYGVLHRLYLVVASLSSNEVQIHQVGGVCLLDHLRVHHELPQLGIRTLAHEPQSARLQDHQVVVVVEVLDCLLGVTHLHFYFFCQVEQGLADEALEEMYVLKDDLVGLFEVVLLHFHWQIGNELSLFLIVKVFPKAGCLFDVVADLVGQILAEVVLIIQLGENLRLLAPFGVLGPDLLDNAPDAVNVVGESHAAEGLDKDQADGFLVVVSHDVSETHSQHDGVGPVVGPTILLVPGSHLDLLHRHPVLPRIQVGHSCEKDGNYVGEQEVEEEDLHQ